MMLLLQKTLRDGNLNAMQKKLELLEQLCRALQKERNDLNNRLSVLQKQGDKDALPPREAHKDKLLTREEEEDEEEEDSKKDKGESEDQSLLQHSVLNNEDISQTPKLLDMDTSSGIEATAGLENSQRRKDWMWIAKHLAISRSPNVFLFFFVLCTILIVVATPSGIMGKDSHSQLGFKIFMSHSFFLFVPLELYFFFVTQSII